MKKTSRNRDSLTSKATAAMQDAIDKLVEDHRRRHMTLAVWQDGKVVHIQADQVSIARESPGRYRGRSHGKKS